MEIKSYNILSVGIGGQGVIRLIEILSYAAMMEGFKIRTAETHGMAQRGGSVAAYLRFGTSVEGPLIPRGKADVVLAFEMSEAVRYFNYAALNTFFFVNDKMVIPPMINQKEYPNYDEIHKFLKQISQHIYFINAEELAKSSGSYRTMNIVMLGVILGAEKLPIKRKHIEDSIFQFIPTKVHDINKKAFEIGIKKGSEIMGGLHE